jgi:hypothetical protein
MRNPLEGVEPTTVYISVGLVALAHVLAIVVWLYAVMSGRAGTKTAWETPPAPRQAGRRAPASAACLAPDARAVGSGAMSISADALRRRRARAPKKDDGDRVGR